jgi:hypothetical protein
MRTHRFGRKIKLPATTAFKHQIRMRMAEYEIKKVEAEARAEACRGQPREESKMPAIKPQHESLPRTPPWSTAPRCKASSLA